MNKDKLKISLKNIATIFISLLLIIITLTNVRSTATTPETAQYVNDLIDCTSDTASWYGFDAAKFVGKTITSGSNLDYNRGNGMCVDEDFPYDGSYKVVNVIDYNVNESGNVIKIYGEKGFENEVSVSDTNAFPLLELISLCKMADGETSSVVGTYKQAIPVIFRDTSRFNKIVKIGIAEYMEPNYRLSQGWGTSVYGAQLSQATAEAQNMAKLGNTETAYLTNTMTEEEKNNISVIESEGKYFIGPYKLNISGTQVGEITINDSITPLGITDQNMKTIESLDKIIDGKEFYIAVDHEIEKIDSINVKSTETVKSYKARIVLISGGASQNFAIYKAEETPQKVSLTLEVPKFGSLQIQKYDEFKNSDVNLEGVGFMVWSESNKAYINVKDGKIQYVDFETAKKNEFKTSNNAKTEIINNLPLGRYKIYETSIPEHLQDRYALYDTTLPDKDGKTVSTKAKLIEVDGQDYVQINNGQFIEIGAENPVEFSSLYIIKTSSKKTNKKALDGIEFKLYKKADLDKDGNVKKEGGWVTFDSSNNKATGFTEEFDKASTLVTGMARAGVTQTVTKLPIGTYIIYETGLGKYSDIYELGYERDHGALVQRKKIDEITLKANEEGVSKIEVENPEVFGALTIKKFDSKTKRPLQGIGFKIKYNLGKESGWLKIDEKTNRVLEYNASFEDATTIYTDADGNTKDVLQMRVEDAETHEKYKYDVYETYIPTKEENSENLRLFYTLDQKTFEPVYEAKTESQALLVEDDITLKLVEASTEKSEVLSNVTSYEIPNPQVYISLSGKVWLDVPLTKNDQVRNNIYDEAEESRVNGIEVKLIDKTTGKVVKTTTTASNGTENGVYKFDSVIIQKLKDYYVEFTYDGVTYQTVAAPNYEELKKNGVEVTDEMTSKVSEAYRQKFNDRFTEITGEGQSINNGDKDVSISYSKEKNTITLSDGSTYESTTVKVNNNCETENGDKLVTITKQGDFLIGSKTDDSYLTKQYEELSKNSEERITEIKNINLGLYERPKSGIELEKDITSTRLAINEFNHVYTYGMKSEEYFEKQKEGFNVGVAFKSKYTQNYLSTIYKDDISYTNEADKSKELRATITYRLALTNVSEGGLVVKANKIADYFDKRYDVKGIKVGTEIDETSKEAINNVKWSLDSEYKNDKYAKLVINANKDVPNDTENGNKGYIYITFELSHEQLAYLVNGVEGKEPLDNVAEITSYTVKKDNKLFAAFDLYSIPNNANPEKTEEFEPDTDKAPALKFELSDSRTMSGVVFEDNAEGETGAGKERKGNGKYDDGEKLIAGVKVQLVETDKDGNVLPDGKVYESDPTGTDGKFTISGYTPAYYKLIYTWGEELGGYNVNDYKGTIYIARDTSKTDWYKLSESGDRLSDALDDYELRQAIDKKDTSKYSDLTKMNSTSERFAIGIDYNGENPSKEITTISEGDKFVRCDVKTMDFGIIHRPVQAIDINKNVKSVKITSGKGDTTEVALDENGKIVEEVKGVTGGKDLGYVKVEMDNDLITGSTAEVGYKISVKNNSELDYDSKDYYLYGTPNGDKIKLKATGVYDYIGGSLSDAEKNETTWETKKVDDPDVTSTETLADGYFKSMYQQIVASNGEVTEIESWEKVGATKVAKVFSSWAETVTTTNFKTAKLADKVVLDYISDQLNKELAPGEDVSADIYTNKNLATTGEISLENEAEIKDVTVVQRPGQKIDPSKSQLVDEAERVTVTPPTGENRDYTTVIIISISALAVLGLGIVIIKKTLLNK